MTVDGFPRRVVLLEVEAEADEVLVAEAVGAIARKATAAPIAVYRYEIVGVSDNLDSLYLIML